MTGISPIVTVPNLTTERQHLQKNHCSVEKVSQKETTLKEWHCAACKSKVVNTEIYELGYLCDKRKEMHDRHAAQCVPYRNHNESISK